jgi:FkbM family methyltransferase
VKLNCDLSRVPPAGQRSLVRIAFTDVEVDITVASSLGEATHQVVDLHGFPFVSHLSERDFCLSKTLEAEGCWEPAESVVLAALARSGGTVLDLGANIGYHTANLARAIGSQGIVYAFEPEPNNFRVLLVNALLLRDFGPPTGRLELHPHAVGATAGRAQLNLYGGNLGLHSLLNMEFPSATQTEVSVVSLDQLRFGDSTTRPAIAQRIDLIKADTQGAELDILRGGERTIAEDRPQLLLEFEPYLTGVSRCVELIDWLAAHGFGHCRLFYATESRPLALLKQLTTELTLNQLKNLVVAQHLGAYATLLLSHPRE